LGETQNLKSRQQILVDINIRQQNIIAIGLTLLLKATDREANYD